MHNKNFSILNADTLSIYNYERRMASFSSVPFDTSVIGDLHDFFLITAFISIA